MCPSAITACAMGPDASGADHRTSVGSTAAGTHRAQRRPRHRQVDTAGSEQWSASAGLAHHQPAHHQPRPLAPDDARDGGSQPVGPVLSPLREDADGRPRRVPARVAPPRHDPVLRHPVEDEDDLRVRELLQPLQALRRNVPGELDDGLHRAPAASRARRRPVRAAARPCWPGSRPSARASSPPGVRRPPRRTRSPATAR